MEQIARWLLTITTLQFTFSRTIARDKFVLRFLKLFQPVELHVFFAGVLWLKRDLFHTFSPMFTSNLLDPYAYSCTDDKKNLMDSLSSNSIKLWANVRVEKLRLLCEVSSRVSHVLTIVLKLEKSFFCRQKVRRIREKDGFFYLAHTNSLVKRPWSFQCCFAAFLRKKNQNAMLFLHGFSHSSMGKWLFCEVLLIAGRKIVSNKGKLVAFDPWNKTSGSVRECVGTLRTSRGYCLFVCVCVWFPFFQVHS